MHSFQAQQAATQIFSGDADVRSGRKTEALVKREQKVDVFAQAHKQEERAE